MTLKRLRYLLTKSKNGTLEEDEEQELATWYQSFAGDSGIIAQLSEEEKMLLERRMLRRIHAEIERRRKEQPVASQPARRRSLIWPLVVILAAVAFVAWLLARHFLHPHN